MDFVKRAAEIREQIIADRRYLHQHPEFGMELPNTCAYVRGRLESMGYTVQDCALRPLARAENACFCAGTWMR